MTVADWIRGATDIELALLLERINHTRDEAMIKQLSEKGFAATFTEIRPFNVVHYLNFLRTPLEGGADK